MAKLLKQKLSKILPSFQTCRNDDCDFPIAVTAARAPAIVSVACGCRPSPSRRNPFVAIDTDAELSRARETTAYLWRHDSLSPPPPPPRRKIDSRRNPNPNPRPSSSSGDSGWFSSDDEIYTDLFNQTSSLTLNNCDDEDDDDDDETETLISSSFTDSSDAINLRKDVEKLTVKESFAVVKRSDDPYSDFRRSMAEMIVEKELYEPGDLEELLQCLLSLNSRHHHRAIISAFSEIWDSLFPATVAASGEQ